MERRSCRGSPFRQTAKEGLAAAFCPENRFQGKKKSRIEMVRDSFYSSLAKGDYLA